MSCQSNNATAPSPAIAPGAEAIDTRAAAELIGTRGIDPRIHALVPGFDAPFFQAGLAGYSDAAMRLVARRHGCPFCVTEALLDRTLLAGGHGFDKADLGELHDNVPGGALDHPLAGQIMGSDPREMAAAALKLVEQRTRPDRVYRELAYGPGGMLPGGTPLRLPGGIQLGPHDDDGGTHELSDPSLDGDPGTPVHGGSFEVVDVNLACPVKKIKSKARGGHWLAEPDGAIEILEAVRESVPASVPCTLKIRRSYDDTPEMVAHFERIFDAAFRIGFAWITVHARTVEQKYVGPSRWSFLRDLVARHPDRLIFGSGDVWEAPDIVRMIAYTGVSAVSVARGCIGNPWIFRQARDLLAGREARSPTVAEQRAVLDEHFRLSLAVTRRFRHGEQHTSKMMRKFAIRFAEHHPDAERVRQRMIRVSSLADWLAALDEFYAPG